MYEVWKSGGGGELYLYWLTDSQAKSIRRKGWHAEVRVDPPSNFDERLLGANGPDAALPAGY